MLVNARHVRCVSGRKSDVLDCQWLQMYLTRIDGIDVTTALAARLGDRRGHDTIPQHQAIYFVAGLVPRDEDPGGKVMSGKTKRCVNRAAQALRLGAYFRRLWSRMDLALAPSPPQPTNGRA